MDSHSNNGRGEKVPGPIIKRNILYGEDTPPEKLDELGVFFMHAHRYSEALDFFEQSGSREQLLQLKARLVDDGDVMLLERLEKILGADFDEKEWEDIARRAASLGKEAYAGRVAARFADTDGNGHDNQETS